MADRKLRTCCTCRKTYKYCPKCQEDKDKPYYHFLFCSENCKNIYDTLSAYEDGRITASEAKMQLDKSDLTRFDDFGESYKSSIAKILTEINETVTEDNPSEIVDETIESFATEASTDEVEPIDNTEEIKPKNYRKSKKRTANVEQ